MKLHRYPDATETAAVQMGIDAAMLATAHKDDPPTIRFYRWSKPTLSLGYFQRIADRSLHNHSRSIDVVRRASGGGAIVHHHEWTYALVWPKPPVDAASVYRLVHGAIATALETRGASVHMYADAPQRLVKRSKTRSVTGDHADQSDAIDGNVPDEPFLCFQRRSEFDLICGGYKILGSAQRRSRNALMQHGSLLMRASVHAPQLPGLVELTGRRLDESGFTDALCDAIATAMDRRVTIVTPSSRLESHIDRTKFGSPDWVVKR